ncbi:transposase family protein [Streptomyces sp. NPDC059118]|uniref:transposase family protein n=1 Tax=unclassified Streptomyces TaxID=2593676 RepID=UPI0036A719AC
MSRPTGTRSPRPWSSTWRRPSPSRPCCACSRIRRFPVTEARSGTWSGPFRALQNWWSSSAGRGPLRTLTDRCPRVTADERARHCPDCGTRARRSKGRRVTRTHDLPVGGRRPRLVRARRR